MMKKNVVKLFLLSALFLVLMDVRLAWAVTPPPLTSISVYVYRTSVYPTDKILAEVTENGVTSTRTVTVNGRHLYLISQTPLPYYGAPTVTGYRLIYDTGYTISKDKGKTFTVIAKGFNTQTSSTIQASRTYTVPMY